MTTPSEEATSKGARNNLMTNADTFGTEYIFCHVDADHISQETSKKYEYNLTQATCKHWYNIEVSIISKHTLKEGKILTLVEQSKITN